MNCLDLLRASCQTFFAFPRITFIYGLFCVNFPKNSFLFQHYFVKLCLECNFNLFLLYLQRNFEVGMERYSEYKDSGVKWLGEIPGHWSRIPFRRVAVVKSNLVHPNELFRLSPNSPRLHREKHRTASTLEERCQL